MEMNAECTWFVNGLADYSSISNVLSPWPETKHKTLTEASRMDDEDPDSESSFSVECNTLDFARQIVERFYQEGAGYHLSLNVVVNSPWGRVEACLCDDRAHAQAYPSTADGKVLQAAIIAHKTLSEALPMEK